MTDHLLDANVLIALAVSEHEHHERATTWLESVDSFALCPVVEGALVRFVLRLGESASTAAALLEGFHQHPGSEFWSDDLSYVDADLKGVRGHRQVTDAYLAALASAHHGRLATFDQALADLRPSDVFLVP